jgi:hypothetical protein
MSSISFLPGEVKKYRPISFHSIENDEGDNSLYPAEILHTNGNATT